MTSLANVESQAQDAFSFISNEASQGAEKAKGYFAKAKAWTLAEVATIRARFAKPAAVPAAPSATSVAKVTVTHGVPLTFVVIGGACLWFASAHEQKVKDHEAQSEWNRAGMQQTLDAANARADASRQKAAQQQEQIDAFKREIAARPKERIVYVKGERVVIRDDRGLSGDDARRLRDIIDGTAGPR